MKLPFYLIEVFNDTSLGFTGNTAAVVWLEEAMEEKHMQAIAASFNQPATTFLWPSSRMHAFHVRWFAPDGEIGLCGHGSLAATVFLKTFHQVPGAVTLLFPGGQIQGEMNSEAMGTISLEAIPVMAELPVPSVLEQGLGIAVKAYFSTSNKHIVLVNSEKELRDMQPDFALLRTSDTFGYAVTAPGDKADFVSRTLVPHVQQLEDPATGSSHAALLPFWAERLSRKRLLAYQLSQRGGKFMCELQDNEVKLSGQYTILAEGSLW